MRISTSTTALLLSRMLNPYVDSATKLACRSQIIRLIPIDLFAYSWFLLFYLKQIFMSMKFRNVSNQLDLYDKEKVWICSYSNIARDGSVLRLPQSWSCDHLTILIPVQPYDESIPLFGRTKEKMRNCLLLHGSPASFLKSFMFFKKVWKSVKLQMEVDPQACDYKNLKYGLVSDCCQYVWYIGVFCSNIIIRKNLKYFSTVTFSFEFQAIEVAFLDYFRSTDFLGSIEGYSASIVRSLDYRYADEMVDTYRDLGVKRIYVDGKFCFQNPRRFSFDLKRFFVDNPVYTRTLTDFGAEVSYSKESRKVLVMASLNFSETKNFLDAVFRASSVGGLIFLIKFHPADLNGRSYMASLRNSGCHNVYDISLDRSSRAGPFGMVIGLGDTSSICNFRGFSGPYLSFATSRELSPVAYNSFFYEVSCIDDFVDREGGLRTFEPIKNQFKRFWDRCNVCT